MCVVSPAHVCMHCVTHIWISHVHAYVWGLSHVYEYDAGLNGSLQLWMNFVRCGFMGCYTCIVRLAHACMRRVTHLNDSCARTCMRPVTYVWICCVTHIWMSHVTHVHESWRTYMCEPRHTCMDESRHTYINESRRTCINESRCTSLGVYESYHTCVGINESRRTCVRGGLCQPVYVFFFVVLETSQCCRFSGANTLLSSSRGLQF